MPVTVKIKDKVKADQAASVAPAPDLSDYAADNERSEGMKAFWLWFIPMLLISVVPMALDSTRAFGLGVLIWWIASWLAYFEIAPRMILRRMRAHGEQYLISTRSNPRLASLIAKGSAMLDIPRPEAFLVDEGIGRIRVSRAGQTYVVLTKPLCEMLQTTELDCLVLRTLVQERQHHVRRMAAVQLLADTPPAARVLAWPVAIYANLLRAFWTDLADQTADRLTLLLIKNDKVLMSAILKLTAASDPLMVENNITNTDIDNFIQQAGVIDSSGATISTQYKIGSSIQANPYLEERVTALRSWAGSAKYLEALNKLNEARLKAEGPRPSPVQSS